MFGPTEHFCGYKWPNHIGVITMVTILVSRILGLGKATMDQHPCRIR